MQVKAVVNTLEKNKKDKNWKESVKDLFEIPFKIGLKNKYLSTAKKKSDSLITAEVNYYQSLVNTLVDAFFYEPGVVAEEVGMNDCNDKCMLSNGEK